MHFRRRAVRYLCGKYTMNTDKPLSKYAAVEAVRKAVEADVDWDKAENEDKLHFYILRAAQNVERFEPFEDEEMALNSYLTNRMAGKRLCDYAWRMFAQSKSA